MMLASTARAQQVDFGVTTGFQSAIWYPNVPGGGARLGFLIGGHASIFLNERIVIKPGLVLSQKGTWLSVKSIPNTTLALTADYISLPALAKFYITRGFHAQIGPQFSYLIASASKANGTKTQASNLKEQVFITPFDMGAVFGLGYEFRSTFTVAINFDISFVNLIKDQEGLATHVRDLQWINSSEDFPKATSNGALQFVFSYNFTKNRSAF